MTGHCGLVELESFADRVVVVLQIVTLEHGMNFKYESNVRDLAHNKFNLSFEAARNNACI